MTLYFILTGSEFSILEFIYYNLERISIYLLGIFLLKKESDSRLFLKNQIFHHCRNIHLHRSKHVICCYLQKYLLLFWFLNWIYQQNNTNYRNQSNLRSQNNRHHASILYVAHWYLLLGKILRFRQINQD